VMVLAVFAGAGTFLLLPSRRPKPVAALGAAGVLAVFLILAVVLIGYAAQQPGGGMGVYFWTFSAVALFGAFRVVTHPRPVYAALYFVLTVFASAGLFVLLWAEFMAAALVLIYAGAILITYVFVIMLAASATTPGARVGKGGNDVLTEYDLVSHDPMIASAVGFALMGVLLLVVFDKAAVPTHKVPPSKPAMELPATAGNTQELGLYLFQDHMVNLELAGLLLTLSMVGAIIIARRKVFFPDEPIGGAAAAGEGAETFNAPLTPIDDNPHSIPVFGTDNPRQKAWPDT
jgi:NADH-quinone oxidoreductase subunit J